MFKLYMDTSIVFFGIISVSEILILTPLMLTQYFIHKKILDPTYYNTDHFSAGELVVFATGYIYYLVKTLIYVRAIVLPKTMRIRFKEDILTFKEHPVVYLLACFSLLLIALGGLALINLIIFLFFYEYNN